MTFSPCSQAQWIRVYGRTAQRAVFWTVALASGLLQAWSARYTIKPDGLNYLDIANSYLRHDWIAAVNAYWSPLYSWLLAMILWIFRVSAYWESTALHAFNVVAYMVALRCGEYFLTQVTAKRSEEQIPDWAVWWIGYAFLLFASLFMITVRHDTPDLLLSGLVYLAAGLLLKIRTEQASNRVYIALGVVLATAYFAKTIMFLLAFVFLFAAGLKKKTALAFASFALASLPWVVVLSHYAGHVTYGDTGPEAYARFVASSGEPVHPVRSLFREPQVREFATPIRATYAPWYNAAYWEQGIHPRVEMGAQLRRISLSISDYLRMMYGEKEFILGFVILLIACRGKLSVRGWVLLPCFVAFVLYGLVWVEPRYVAAFCFVMWSVLFAGLNMESRRLVLGVAIFIVAVSLFKIGREALHEPLRPKHEQ